MDLTTRYLGLDLKNPLVAAAGPASRDLDAVRALEDSGIAAIVLFSLFEEQLTYEMAEHEHYQELGAGSSAEATSYAPAESCFPPGAQEYLDHLAKVKEAVNIPIIASLNGTTMGGWIENAKKLEQAGADAIELNVYSVATDPQLNAQQIENRYLEIASEVKKTVSLPVAMKLSPFFTSLANFAKQLDELGVDGLVLFNRFYQPNIDLDTLEVTPDLTFSAGQEMRLPLRWIAILDPIIKGSLAATTGIYTSSGVLKLLLAGADATMLCAALLKGGPGIVTHILGGIVDWMEEREYTSVSQLKGSMNQSSCEDPAAFERANYVRTLFSFAG